MVSTGHHGEGSRSSSCGRTGSACDPPQTASRLVVVVPGTPTVARHPEGQGHAVVDPVLESNKPTRLVTRGIEAANRRNLRSAEKGSRKKKRV